MAREQRRRTIFAASKAGLCWLGVIGCYLAITRLVEPSQLNLALIIILACACRLGFCAALQVHFREDAGFVQRLLSAGVAFTISSLTVVLLVQGSGWEFAFMFLGVDAALFGLTTADYLALRKAQRMKISMFGDEIGVYETLREFGRQQGDLMVLYLPKPPHSKEMDRAATAFVDTLKCMNRIRGPWIVDADHVATSFALTHEHLFRHHPKYFEVYHMPKDSLSDISVGSELEHV